MLKNLIDEDLINYAAMDIKNSRIRYNETCGSEVLPQIEKKRSSFDERKYRL